LARLEEAIREECLINKHASVQEEQMKLLPTQRDRSDFAAAMLGQPEADRTQIGVAWRFFDQVINHGDLEGNLINLERLKTCVTGYLNLVSITLDPDDSPHRIFESLNNTGMKLGPSALIRNYLFMQILDEGEQQAAYDNIWFPMQESLKGYIDGFFWRYVMKDGALIRWDETYAQMQAVVENRQKVGHMQITDFLSELRSFSDHYRRLLWPTQYEQNLVLRRLISFLNDWEVEVAYPFLLNLFDELAKNEVAADEVAQILSITQSFIVRRTVCGVPTNQLRRIFARMSAETDHKNYLESSRAYLLRNQWPGDSEFHDRFQAFRLYIPGRLARTRLVLEALEQSFGHKEPVDPNAAITIEHIMPQSLNEPWLEMLGARAEEIYGRWLHTVGNLTLSGYNSDMGNRPFEEKKQILRESHLELNKDIAACEVWTEDTIRARAQTLADRAIRIWKRE